MFPIIPMILLLPLCCFLLTGLLLYKGKGATFLLLSTATLVSILVMALTHLGIANGAHGPTGELLIIDWMTLGPNTLSIICSGDRFSYLMTTLFCGIVLLIFIHFAILYRKGEGHVQQLRFLLLLLFWGEGLVLSHNLFTFYVMSCGLNFFLSYFGQMISPGEEGKKAYGTLFMVDRISDILTLVGLVGFFSYLGDLSFDYLRDPNIPAMLAKVPSVKIFGILLLVGPLIRPLTYSFSYASLSGWTTDRSQGDAPHVLFASFLFFLTGAPLITILFRIPGLFFAWDATKDWTLAALFIMATATILLSINRKKAMEAFSFFLVHQILVAAIGLCQNLQKAAIVYFLAQGLLCLFWNFMVPLRERVKRDLLGLFSRPVSAKQFTFGAIYFLFIIWISCGLPWNGISWARNEITLSFMGGDGRPTFYSYLMLVNSLLATIFYLRMALSSDLQSGVLQFRPGGDLQKLPDLKTQKLSQKLSYALWAPLFIIVVMTFYRSEERIKFFTIIEKILILLTLLFGGKRLKDGKRIFLRDWEYTYPKLASPLKGHATIGLEKFLGPIAGLFRGIYVLSERVIFEAGVKSVSSFMVVSSNFLKCLNFNSIRTEVISLMICMLVLFLMVFNYFSTNT